MNLEANATKTLGNGQLENELETDAYDNILEKIFSRQEADPQSVENMLELMSALAMQYKGSGLKADDVLLLKEELARCHVPGASEKRRMIEHDGATARLVIPDAATAEQVRAEKKLAEAVYPEGEGDINKIIEGLSPADRDGFVTALKNKEWGATDDLVSLSLKAAKYAREKVAKAKTIRVRRAVRFVPIRNRARAQVRRAPRPVKLATKASVAASSPGGDSSGGEPPSSDPDLPRPHDRRLTPSAIPFRDGASQVSFNGNLILHTQMAACELSALLLAHVLSLIVGGCSR